MEDAALKKSMPGRSQRAAAWDPFNIIDNIQQRPKRIFKLGRQRLRQQWSSSDPPAASINRLSRQKRIESLAIRIRLPIPLPSPLLPSPHPLWVLVTHELW